MLFCISIVCKSDLISHYLLDVDCDSKWRPQPVSHCISNDWILWRREVNFLVVLDSFFFPLFNITACPFRQSAKHLKITCLFLNFHSFQYIMFYRNTGHTLLQLNKFPRCLETLVGSELLKPLRIHLNICAQIFQSINFLFS